jgi:transcriptional regulator with XRE-family HTH domain
MATKSGDSPAASRMMVEQSRRLVRLRQLVGLKQVDAAASAQVTKDSWGRAERAEIRIDAVALARFLAAYNLPAGYVITGSYEGLPPELLRDIIRAEAEDAAAEG